jgi:hypothetical protein
VLFAWLVPPVALADFYEPLLELRGTGKTAPTIVLLRQVPDLTSGFDQYYLDLWKMGDSSPAQSHLLASKSADVLARAGHFELYRKKVQDDQEARATALKEKGYATLSPIRSQPGSMGDSLRLCTEVLCLDLTLPRDLSQQTLTLAGNGQSTVLHRFGKSAPGNPRVTTVRTIRSAILVGQGTHRGLLVVIRGISAPTSQLPAHDELLWLPLARPLRRLQISDPLGDLVGPQPVSTGEQ